MRARASWSSALSKRGNVCLYNKHLLPLEKGKIIYPTALFLDSIHQKKYYIEANKAFSPTAVYIQRICALQKMARRKQHSSSLTKGVGITEWVWHQTEVWNRPKTVTWNNSRSKEFNSNVLDRIINPEVSKLCLSPALDRIVHIP